MKSSFWYFIIHFWGIQFFDDGIDIWCPFFECQLGYTKEINYDMYISGIIIRWGNNWSLEPYANVFKYRFEKIYDRISLKCCYELQLPWYDLQKKYIGK